MSIAIMYLNEENVVVPQAEYPDLYTKMKFLSTDITKQI